MSIYTVPLAKLPEFSHDNLFNGSRWAYAHPNGGGSFMLTHTRENFVNHFGTTQVLDDVLTVNWCRFMEDMEYRLLFLDMYKNKFEIVAGASRPNTYSVDFDHLDKLGERFQWALGHRSSVYVSVYQDQIQLIFDRQGNGGVLNRDPVRTRFFNLPDVAVEETVNQIKHLVLGTDPVKVPTEVFDLDTIMKMLKDIYPNVKHNDRVVYQILHKHSQGE